MENNEEFEAARENVKQIIESNEKELDEKLLKTEEKKAVLQGCKLELEEVLNQYRTSPNESIENIIQSIGDLLDHQEELTDEEFNDLANGYERGLELHNDYKKIKKEYNELEDECINLDKEINELKDAYGLGEEKNKEKGDEE